jgi:hypothetical protein
MRNINDAVAHNPYYDRIHGPAYDPVHCRVRVPVCLPFGPIYLDPYPYPYLCHARSLS